MTALKRRCSRTPIERAERSSRGADRPILGPAEAFELAGGPIHRLVHGFALFGVLGDHLGRRRLREDLVADPHRRRRAGDRLDDITARRVIPDAALWRTLLGPGLEVAQSSERRNVVSLAAGNQPLDRIFLPQI